jgi:hypothetical protein
VSARHQGEDGLEQGAQHWRAAFQHVLGPAAAGVLVDAAVVDLGHPAAQLPHDRVDARPRRAGLAQDIGATDVKVDGPLGDDHPARAPGVAGVEPHQDALIVDGDGPFLLGQEPGVVVLGGPLPRPRVGRDLLAVDEHGNGGPADHVDEVEQQRPEVVLVQRVVPGPGDAAAVVHGGGVRGQLVAVSVDGHVDVHRPRPRFPPRPGEGHDLPAAEAESPEGRVADLVRGAEAAEPGEDFISIAESSSVVRGREPGAVDAQVDAGRLGVDAVHHQLDEGLGQAPSLAVDDVVDDGRVEFEMQPLGLFSHARSCLSTELLGRRRPPQSTTL